MPVGETLAVEYRDPRDLKANPDNAKKHPPDQITAIRESQRRVGFYNPILLKDDRETIGVGNGRWEAACLEGLPQVPTIVLEGLTEAEWAQLVLLDNRLAEGGSWREDILKRELGKLGKLGITLSGLGFSASGLGAIGGLTLGAGRRLKANPESVPPNPDVPVSRLGDLWTLGEHALICGDATDPAVVAAVMGGAVAALCLTDPPYGIGFDYKDHDDSDNDANADLVAKAFALAPAAKVWSPGGNNLARDISRFGRTRILYWYKGYSTRSNGLGGASTVEPFLVVGPPKRRKLRDDHLDFKTDREEVAGKSLREHHPCPKPVALFQTLAEAFCAAGGRVYEPFSGSGTTLIACELSGRRCHAVEIDPSYVDVAILRWQGITGKEAVHASGKTYLELRDERTEG